MPVLSNQRHELFAQEVAKGASASEAFVKAGYAKNDGNASRLRGNEKVAARVEEILSQSAIKAGVTVERVLNEIALLGFANMADYMKVGVDGDPHLDFSSLRRDQAAALIEVTVEDFKEGRGPDARDVRRVKFKLADKLGALEKLGKHLGMFTDKLQHSNADGSNLDLTTRIVFVDAGPASP